MASRLCSFDDARLAPWVALAVGLVAMLLPDARCGASEPPSLRAGLHGCALALLLERLVDAHGTAPAGVLATALVGALGGHAAAGFVLRSRAPWLAPAFAAAMLAILPFGASGPLRAGVFAGTAAALLRGPRPGGAALADGARVLRGALLVALLVLLARARVLPALACAALAAPVEPDHARPRAAARFAWGAVAVGALATASLLAARSPRDARALAGLLLR